MKLELVSDLSKEDSEHLFYWRDQVFPEEGRELSWSKSSWHLLAYDKDEKPVAHIGYSGFVIDLDNNIQQTVIGVGGVVVRPEYQRKGIPERMFQSLHESAEALEISGIFTLFCPHRLESYYQQHGYKTFTGQTTFMQGEARTSSDKFIFMYYGAEFSSAVISLKCEPW